MTQTMSGGAGISTPDPATADRENLDSSSCRFAGTGADAPGRVEVAMPRGLFDRLTDHDEAPRCRYETATGRAEFVAEPTFAHESRAAVGGELFTRVAVELEAAGSPIELQASRATRLLGDDGAFEPDEGLLIGSEKIAAAERAGGWLDVRRGHPVPDLVSRSTAAPNRAASSPPTSGWACARRGPGAVAAALSSGSPARRPSRFGASPPAACCRARPAMRSTSCSDCRPGRRACPRCGNSRDGSRASWSVETPGRTPEGAGGRCVRLGCRVAGRQRLGGRAVGGRAAGDRDGTSTDGYVPPRSGEGGGDGLARSRGRRCDSAPPF